MREAINRGANIDIDDFEQRLRSQEARRAAQADPLRELARLMQEPETDATAQRYAQIFDDHRHPAEEAETDFGFHHDTPHEASEAAAPQEHYDDAAEWEPAETFADEDLPPPLRGSFDAHAPQGAAPDRVDWGRRQAAPASFGVQRDFDPQNARAAGSSHAQAEEADYDAYGDAGQAQEYYSEAHGDYEDYPSEPYAEPNERVEQVKRGFRVKPWQAVAAAAIVGALGVGWGVARIKGVAGSREVATIAAPAGPTKVAPAADAAQTTKEDATVLDRGQETPVKNLGSTQEAPVEPVVAPPQQQPQQPAATETYRRVKTVVIREDNAVNPTIAPPAVERAAAPPAAPAAPTTTPQNTAPPATTAQKAPPPPPAAPAKKKVASLPAEPAAQEAAEPSEPASETPASGSASVQFGAAPNETEARALAKKVVAKYGSRLHGHKPTWKIAEVGDKTVYRVRVGGLSKEAAASLCKSVKSDGGDCYVAGN
jgi:hypothetical protein